MYTSEIDAILGSDTSTRAIFRGTLPSDGMEKCNLPQYFFIVNTQKSGKPGQHWQMVFIKRNISYFFCSLGRMPKGPIRKFLSTFKCTYYNKCRPQRGAETTCGGYAILVASLMARGHTFANVCKLFDLIKNDDDFIKEFMLARYMYTFEKK